MNYGCENANYIRSAILPLRTQFAKLIVLSQCAAVGLLDWGGLIIRRRRLCDAPERPVLWSCVADVCF